jgi:hypothetical protein
LITVSTFLPELPAEDFEADKGYLRDKRYYDHAPGSRDDAASGFC